MADQNLAIACLRGLIDTDGSVSRRGSQFTITFYSKNKNLTNQVHDISKNSNLFTFISKDGRTIGTNNQIKIRNYFDVVGTSNLRHLVRFYQKFFFGESIYQKDVIKYYQKDLYRHIKLPFKTVPSSNGS